MTTPPGPLRRDPRVFISAVTRELGSIRKLVKKALEDGDHQAIEQDNFPLDYRDLVEKLRHTIARCDAVVHIAGHAYGAEPENRPPESPQRSYTQLEYEIARELNKPIYTFLTADLFPTDPHDPESLELRELQEAHRHRLTSTGREYAQCASADDLDRKVRGIRLQVEKLGEELQQVDRKVEVIGRRSRNWLALIVLVGLASLATLGIVIHRQQAEHQAQIQEAEKAERERQKAETARKEARKVAQIESEFAERFLQQLLTNKDITAEDARQRALKELPALVHLPPAEIQSLIDRKIAPPAAQATLTPLEKARAALARGNLDEVFRAAGEEKREGRELALLEGTAALARFHQSPEPEWTKRALAAFRRALALSDPEAPTEWEAWSLAAVSEASLLTALAQYREAEPLLRDALKLSESRNGPDSPKDAVILNELARLLSTTNRTAEVELLYRRALAIDERAFGPDHPSVATKLNNLAGILEAGEAEPLYRRALAIDERAFGPDHPSVAGWMNNLARLLVATRRAAEAEPLYRRALAIHERSLSPSHPLIVAELNNLASLLKETSRAAEAEPLQRRALAIDERALGPDDPTVAGDLNNLAMLLKATGRTAQADPLLVRAVSIYDQSRQSNGYVHPELHIAVENYHKTLASRGLAESEIGARLDKAREVLEKLSPIVPEVDRLLGQARPVAEVLASLDRQYKEQGRPPIYFLGPNDPIIRHLNELLRISPVVLAGNGVTALERGDHAEAIASCDIALELMVDHAVEDQVRLSIGMTHAVAMCEIGLVGPARDELAKLLREIEKRPNSEDSMKDCIRCYFAICLWRLGERAEAQKSAESALSAYAATPKEIPVDSDLRKELEELLGDLKAGKAPPPAPSIDARAAIAAARSRIKAREDLTTLGLDQPAVPLLDRILGPARPVREVLDGLDRQYREQGKPGVWFLPLDQPISPHLDELRGRGPG